MAHSGVENKAVMARMAMKEIAASMKYIGKVRRDRAIQYSRT